MTGNRTGPCPRCGLTVRLREDGTYGLHWSSNRKSEQRYRCPAGGQAQPPRGRRRARRVSVSFDVMLPEGWDVARFRAEAHQLIRARLDEVFVIRVDAGVAEEG